MSRSGVAVLGLLLLAPSAVGGCGEADEPAAPPTVATTTTSSGEIELNVVYDDGAGGHTTGELTCRAGDVRASGELYAGRAAPQLCSKARELTELLTTQPDTDRICTQMYGGPETARVTGTMNGKPVDRRFTRTNGCELADFNDAAMLLAP